MILRPVMLARLLLAAIPLLPGPAFAQAGAEWLLGSRLGGLKPALSYDTTLVPGRGVAGQGTDFGFTQHRLRGSLPLLQSDRHEWSLFGGLRALDIDTRAVLPTTGSAFPDTLWEIGLGTAARGRLENGWTLGGALQVGSPSDRPFAGLDETTLTADAFLRVPWSAAWAGIFLLNYATAREVAPGIPLPGVALAYEPGRELALLLGVPLSAVRWTPAPDWELSASSTLLRTVRAQAGYRLLEPLRAFVGFDWDSQRFFRHDRLDDNHRLSYDEKRIGGGLRWEPTPHLVAELSGGYAFDRFWFEGKRYADRSHNRLDIGDGPYVQLRVGFRF